jgi:hypothetical protein
MGVRQAEVSRAFFILHTTGVIEDSGKVEKEKSASSG